MKPNPFPPAAVAAFAAGLDEYRLVTPYEQQTPDEAALFAAEALVTAGWAVHIPRQNRTGMRRPCPDCGEPQLRNRDGRIRRHGDADNPCPGSGSPHRIEATA